MGAIPRCPECGAAWTDGKTCSDAFHEMLAWEFEHGLPDVHHLVVLCYHLQHPSLYSPAGLASAQGLLVDFVERGVTPDAARRRSGPRLDSGKRTFKIKGTPSSHGAYPHPPAWTMTAADVVAGGVGNYYDNVRRWARLTLEALRSSGP